MTDTRDTRLRVAILGSGNIGSDLLSKAMRSPLLECTRFVGRNMSSRGIARASRLGVPVSDGSIHALTSDPDAYDLVFDATSALMHPGHSEALQALDKIVIDLTPSDIGGMCVPAVNLAEALELPDVNMVTCGGQATIPLAAAVAEVHGAVDYIEVISQIASRSAGPATRVNLDEYIETTERGIRRFTGCRNAKAILNINPAQPCVDMQATVLAVVNEPDLDRLRPAVDRMVERVQAYVPGYELIVPPTLEAGRIVIMVRVRGIGDYLPCYAGNLDIINCAAIAVAEEHARARRARRLEDCS